MAVIEIEDALAASLRARAEERDMTLRGFLEHIAETTRPLDPKPPLSLDEFDRFVDELATESPVLPETFSRADIYLEVQSDIQNGGR